MKKTHILIIIAAIVFVFFIRAILYFYFDNRIDNNTRQGFIDETVQYLSENEEFITKYGSLISADSKDKMPIKNTDSKYTEYYMDFTCVTENGNFNVRVYHTWIDAWTYRFEEICDS